MLNNIIASPCWPCHQQQVCGSQAQGRRQHGSPSLRACCSCNGESCWRRWSGGESNIEMKVIDAEEHTHFTGMQDGGTLTGWRMIKVSTVAQKRQKWWSKMLTRLWEIYWRVQARRGVLCLLYQSSHVLQTKVWFKSFSSENVIYL